MDKKLTLTIGIPAYNEEANIKYLLESLLTQKQDNFILEKIIVNSDGSTDKTVELAKSLNNPLIEVWDNKDRKGKSNRLNEIFDKTVTDFLILIDADVVIVNKSLIGETTEYANLNKLDLLAIRNNPGENKSFVQEVINTGVNINRKIASQWKKGNNIYGFCGRYMVLSKSLYESISMPDTFGTDAYIYLLAKQQKLKSLYTDLYFINYNLPRSIEDHTKQSTRFMNSRFMLEKIFNKSLEKEYTYPSHIFLKALFINLLASPISTVGYISLMVYIRLFRYQTVRLSGIWDVSNTSKTYNTVNYTEDMNNNGKSILYFGAYDRLYTRNRILISGLTKNNVKVVECHVKKLDFDTIHKLSIICYFTFAPFYNLYRYIILIHKSIKILKTNDYDCILLAYPGHLDIIPAKILSKLIKKPLVFDPYISIYGTFCIDRKVITNIILKNLVKYIECQALHLVDLVIYDTTSKKAYFEKIYNTQMKKSVVVYIGADNSIYYPTERTYSKDGPLSIVFSGFLSPHHGVEYIIKAAKSLEHSHPNNFIFTIIGDGQSFQSSLNLAKQLSVNSIKFTGKMPEVDTVKYLNDADIILGIFKNSLKANTELQNKIFQAMALRKAIITADTSAVAEINESGFITTCKPDNPESLAEKILMLKDKTIRDKLAEEGYKVYKTEFTPEIISAKFIKTIC